MLQFRRPAPEIYLLAMGRSKRTHASVTDLTPCIASTVGVGLAESAHLYQKYIKSVIRYGKGAKERTWFTQPTPSAHSEAVLQTSTGSPQTYARE